MKKLKILQTWNSNVAVYVMNNLACVFLNYGKFNGIFANIAFLFMPIPVQLMDY